MKTNADKIETFMEKLIGDKGSYFALTIQDDGTVSCVASGSVINLLGMIEIKKTLIIKDYEEKRNG